MDTIIRQLCLLFVLMIPVCGRAQIPTTDIINNITSLINQGQQMSQWAQQIQSMYNQINAMERQYTQMEREYERITGTRNLGDIFNNPLLRHYLPQDWLDIYDATKRGGYASLTGRARDIHNDNTVHDMCAGLLNDTHRISCESQASQAAQDQVFASNAYDAAVDRVSQIESLMGEINNTEDPKGVAELQARLAVEQAAIQNEQIKLAMFQMIAESQKDLQMQRLREHESSIWSKNGDLELRPLTF